MLFARKSEEKLAAPALEPYDINLLIATTCDTCQFEKYLNRNLFEEKDKKALRFFIKEWASLPISVKKTIFNIVKANKKKLHAV